MRSHDLNRLLDKPGFEVSTVWKYLFRFTAHGRLWVAPAGGAGDSERHCNAREPRSALLRVTPAAFDISEIAAQKEQKHGKREVN